MGLFTSKAEREARAKAKAEAKEAASNAAMINVAESKGISYSNDDLYALRCLYDAFEENGNIHVSSTSITLDDSDGNSCNNNLGNITYDVLSGIEDLDGNNFRFFKAIIEQNYMTMRKVDALNDRLELLIDTKNRASSPHSTTGYCSQCGKPRNSGDVFCSKCGHKH
jgi:hypothetical protein